MAVICFLRWVNRAYLNLPALSGRQLTFSAGWAIGSWFVPFLNLVRPFQIVREIWWVSSSPAEAARAAAHFKPATPAFIGWWWAIYLLSGFIGNMVFRMAMRAETIPQLLELSYAMLFADIVSVVAAVLAIVLVHRISKAQERAARPLVPSVAHTYIRPAP